MQLVIAFKATKPLTTTSTTRKRIEEKELPAVCVLVGPIVWPCCVCLSGIKYGAIDCVSVYEIFYIASRRSSCSKQLGPELRKFTRVEDVGHHDATFDARANRPIFTQAQIARCNAEAELALDL